jgi:hypothetical protein
VVELLSSRQTFFSKFIFPPIWIGASGLGLMKAGFGAPARGWPIVFVGWIVASGFVYWSCARLKRVSIDEQFLYVSNYFNEIAIPFSDIGDVTQNPWMNNQHVTIHFKVPTEFGGAIVFMPRFRFFPFVGPHPVVDRLKQLANIT